MSDPRPIQRFTKGGLQAPGGAAPGAIMTPQGPAVIQVIDMGGGSGGLALGGGQPPKRKVGGINIVGAVLKRWWLVLLVTVAVGGAAYFVAKTMLKPVYEASVLISYYDPNGTGDSSAIKDVVRRGLYVLNARDIPLLAARERELQELYPDLLVGKNLDDPEVQQDVVDKLSKMVDSEEIARTTNVVRIYALQPTPVASMKIANAFARAFVKWCEETTNTRNTEVHDSIQKRLDQTEAELNRFREAERKLKMDNSFDANQQKYSATLQQIAKIKEEELKARVELAAADENLNATREGGQRKRRPKQERARIDLIDTEKAKDKILAAYVDQLSGAINKRGELLGQGMTEDHPAVKLGNDAIERAKENVRKRETEIAADIEGRIQKVFDADDKVTVADAEERKRNGTEMLRRLEEQLKGLDDDAQKLYAIKDKIEEMDRRIAVLDEQHKFDKTLLNSIEQAMIVAPAKKSFKIEELAKLPPGPKEDKRVKVQAAGIAGGLFLGILLALLIDRFDKRLRDPRDVEVMLDAPLLGTIPKIQELKRFKGEQARNLIAEEFRIIRTQVLFGNPELQYKILAIVSPQPGDGKTSLAVNLAISIAKAGRRVLLIDGDLRKPDIHRVFNIPDSPGFSEVIAGSSEPGQVVRKSDIEGLEILAAGTPLVRPSELLSRPDVARLLLALGELYDHIVLDTAPLLPVSDTHVLAGMVDGCICSFNAEVDRDTVALTQQILQRCRANVIGSVMNQVKYKQSGSYHRGKSAYDSYYSSPRGGMAPAATPAAGRASGAAPGALDATHPDAVATVHKP